MVYFGLLYLCEFCVFFQRDCEVVNSLLVTTVYAVSLADVVVGVDQTVLGFAVHENHHFADGLDVHAYF